MPLKRDKSDGCFNIQIVSWVILFLVTPCSFMDLDPLLKSWVSIELHQRKSGNDGFLSFNFVTSRLSTRHILVCTSIYLCLAMCILCEVWLEWDDWIGRFDMREAFAKWYKRLLICQVGQARRSPVITEISSTSRPVGLPRLFWTPLERKEEGVLYALSLFPLSG